MSGPRTVVAAARAREIIDLWSDPAKPEDLDAMLRMLGKWRSGMLARTYLQHEGARIWSGLFEGMQYLDDVAEGSHIARLLGTYEADLQPYIRAIIEEGADCLIDVGCAEGYYAVGLARRWPELEVRAFDIDPEARSRCADLARRNGVEDRVQIGGEFKPQDFQDFADRRPLVLVDAEGAEVDILVPELAPALARMAIVVETHDVWRPGAMATLMERFAPTHDIVRVDQMLHPVRLPSWLMEFSEMDQMLAQWEWRARSTPWLVMRPKA